MDESLALFLRAWSPSVEEEDTWSTPWGDLHLRVASYVSDELPPPGYITSVRAVIVQRDTVLVVRDPVRKHILPGGRREVSESLLQTLEREVAEETGWTLTLVMLLGFKHFHHLSPKPADYPFPYPDFLQAIYAARPETYDPAARERNGYELEAQFRPIVEVQHMRLTQGEQVYLCLAATGLADRQTEG